MPHTLECYKCSATIVLSDAKYKRCHEAGEGFTCPNGHSQTFCTTENSKLKQCIKYLEGELRFMTAARGNWRRGHHYEVRRRAGYQGQCVKLQKRTRDRMARNVEGTHEV